MKNRFVIIGLGGVGTYLIQPLCRFINYNESFKEESKVIFVDGDSYETKNNDRQDFKKLGNKAITQYGECQHKYDDIEFDYISEYITSNNIKDIILENDYVFICVDNHATRNLVSMYGESLNNINIISGGNEHTDGNIQIFIKKDGKEVTPTLTKYHPEIKNPDDKNPNDMSCQELAISEPQLIFANMGVATFMCFAFYNIINNNYKYCETYFDISIMSADGKVRKP